jgi:hypothetical protein
MINFNDRKKNIKLFCSYTGQEKLYDIEQAFQKLSIENIPNDQITEIIKNRMNNESNYNLSFLNMKLKNTLEFFDQSLQEKLNKIIRSVFEDKVLVLVDKNLGYKPVKKMEHLSCIRITSGSPRCKYNPQ